MSPRKLLGTKAAVNLIQEKLANDSAAIITIKGESMLPFYQDGETEVRLVRPKRPFKKGDAVLYPIRGDSHFLHRVHKVKKDHLIVVGDALKKKEEIPKAKIIALVEVHRKKGKWVLERSLLFRGKLFFWRKLFPIRRILIGIFRRIKNR